MSFCFQSVKHNFQFFKSPSAACINTYRSFCTSSSCDVAISETNFPTSAIADYLHKKYLASSSIFSAVDFPAPDMPVTITSRMFYLLLKFSQKFHFRFKCHSKFSIYNLCYMLHQAAYIFSSSVSCIDHKAAVFLRYLGSTHAITPQSAVHDQLPAKYPSGRLNVLPHLDIPAAVSMYAAH